MARLGPKNNNKEKSLASQSCSGYLRNSEISPFLSPDWVSLSVSKVREEFGGSWQRHSKGRKFRAWGTVEATGKLALSPQMLSAGMNDRKGTRRLQSPGWSTSLHMEGPGPIPGTSHSVSAALPGLAPECCPMEPKSALLCYSLLRKGLPKVSFTCSPTGMTILSSSLSSLWWG